MPLLAVVPIPSTAISTHAEPAGLNRRRDHFIHLLQFTLFTRLDGVAPEAGRAAIPWATSIVTWR